MLVSQLEDDVGKEWLAAVTHASVKLSQFGWAVVRSRPDS